VGTIMVRNYLIQLIGMARAILWAQRWYVIFATPYRDGHKDNILGKTEEYAVYLSTKSRNAYVWAK